LTTTPESKLFTPFSIRAMTLRNRMVRSATAEKVADPSGLPDKRLAATYAALAAGGVGLIITGHAFVQVGGRAHARMTGAHHDYMVESLADLAESAHDGGAAICLQMNHGGRACDPDVVAEPVGPSPVAVRDGAPVPRELTEEGIRTIVESFGAAAGRAKDASFDAVQIHAAHGYLLSQFLSPLANVRRDRYGGSLRNRARFLAEVAEVVRTAVGKDTPVLVKLGVTDNLDGGLTLDEGAEVASWLRDFGIDAVEVSTGGKGAIATRVTRPEREAYLLPLAKEVRRRTDLPVILVGGLRSRAVMEQVLAQGVDLVSLSRPLIREPDLPKRLRSGEADIAACVSCNRCWPLEPGEGVSCKKLDSPPSRD
jgi:2,4-dienoyl-CoA reductase-like NADH-dependent reductase (Old Yellow Enzyme family)